MYGAHEAMLKAVILALEPTEASPSPCVQLALPQVGGCLACL